MDRIRIERQGGVCAIAINRPDRLNAIDDDMIRVLTGAFKALADYGETRVVTIGGVGKHFSAGGDIGNISDWISTEAEKRRETFTAAVRSLSKPMAMAMLRVPQPVVASVRGHAIGIALQIVLLADLVNASETAKFSMPQLDLGYTPDHGETWALPRKIGMARAMQLSLMAERIDAATTERYSLVNWVTPDSDLDARTASIAARIAACPPVAAQGAKALFLASERQSLSEALDGESVMLGKVAMQEDFVEAITAFNEKRRPVFKGK